MVHGHRPGDRPAAFTGGHALEGLGLLMIGELRFASEPRAFGLGGDTTVVSSLEDPVTLVLGQRRQEGQDAAIDGLGEVKVVAV